MCVCVCFYRKIFFFALKTVVEIGGIFFYRRFVAFTSYVERVLLMAFFDA